MGRGASTKKADDGVMRNAVIGALGPLAVGNPAAALGVGGLVAGLRAAMATSGGELPPAAQATVAAPAVAAAMAAPTRQDAQATSILDNIRTLFPGMKELSLNQLGALTGSLGNMIPATAKAPVKPADIAGLQYLDMVKAERDAAVLRAQAAKNPQAELEADSVAMKRLAEIAGVAIPGLSDKVD